jgi:hypothetical protein
MNRRTAACDELPSACSGPELVEGSRVEQGTAEYRSGKYAPGI